MKTSLVQLTLRRWVEITTSGRLYLMMFGFLILGTILGPYGTFNQTPLFERFVISLQLNTICWVIGVGVIVPVRLSLQRLGLHAIPSLVIGCLAASALIIPTLSYMLNILVNVNFNWAQFAEHVVLFTALVGLVSIAMLGSTGVFTGKENAGKVSDDIVSYEISSTTPRDPDRCPLQSRLPREKRGILYAMVAQDHYVEMITNKGSELVLMRLSDAVRLANPKYGMRIHRSAWVSLFGAASLNKTGRRTFVTLRNGRELPVSRSSENELRSFFGGASDIEGLQVA